jgi:membrane protein YdbS with pleckstrin-like domain
MKNEDKKPSKFLQTLNGTMFIVSMLAICAALIIENKNNDLNLYFSSKTYMLTGIVLLYLVFIVPLTIFLNKWYEWVVGLPLLCSVPTFIIGFLTDHFDLWFSKTTYILIAVGMFVIALVLNKVFKHRTDN